MSEETAPAKKFAEFSDEQIAAYPQTARCHIVGLADLCESKSAQLEALKTGAKYPDSDCETHKDVITSGPVCIVCMGSELSALRERVKELEGAIRKEFPEPDMNAHDGPCCSRFEDGRWVSTGCDCGNSDDTASASEWRRDANLHLKFKALLSTGREEG